jgi:hypothetical protein
MINALRCLLAAPLFILADVCFGMYWLLDNGCNLLGTIGRAMQRASKYPP